MRQTRALPDSCRQSGDDSVLADVWEEFKYQIQRGESCVMEAYEETIRELCCRVVKKLPQHERDLLWLWSEAYYDWHEEEEPSDKDDDLVAELYSRVCSRAADEELKRDPDDESGLIEEGK